MAKRPAEEPLEHATKHIRLSDKETTEEPEDEEMLPAAPKQNGPLERQEELYLDTIDLGILDFDFEKTCCETLATHNIYACLICGKFYQGKGQKTPAYLHSLRDGHHVFMNMDPGNKKIWVLPENYQIKDTSLRVTFPPGNPINGATDGAVAEKTGLARTRLPARYTLADIQWQIEPKQTEQELQKLDASAAYSRDIYRSKYRPGFIGINNLRESAYATVVLHAICHILPIRDFFLLKDLEKSTELVKRFVMLLRKYWNPRAFQKHVSPHELFQEIAQRSKHAFTHDKAADPVEFMQFLLHKLHTDIGGKKTPNSSVIHKAIQGALQIESQEITARADQFDLLRFDEGMITTSSVHYLFLPIDLPPMPVFAKGRADANNIPQISIIELLNQYDGRTPKEKGSRRQRFRLLYPPPPYIIITIKRFVPNEFRRERNSTIVTFDTDALDLTPFILPGPWRTDPDACVEYDLVANVTHETVSTRADSISADMEKDIWRVQLRDRVLDKWVVIDDLNVTDLQVELLYLQESYIQVWENRSVAKERLAAQSK